MKRVVVWSLLGVFIFFALSIIVGPMYFRALLANLPLGWWRFLQRNLAELTWNWTLITTGVVCSGFLLVAGHWLLRALAKQAQSGRPSDQTPHPWRLHWTLSLYAGLWLVFVIALGAAGIFHHTTWLLADKEPWYEERLNYFLEFRRADGQIQMQLSERDSDLEKTHDALAVDASWNHRTGFREEFDVIFYAGNDNKITAYVIVPRRPRIFRQGRFAVFETDRTDYDKPLSELETTIARLDAKYPRKRS